VEIFVDWQNETDLLGEGELIEFVEQGLTFYPESELKKSNPILYIGEKWLVKFSWGEKYCWIRKKIYDGKSDSARSSLTNYQSKYDLLIDETDPDLG
jgi:hypothetical protein